MAPLLPAGLQEPHAPFPITFSRVLLVEGKGPFQFFKALLRLLSLVNSIEIRNFGGVTEFSVYLETLIATPGYANVVSLGIIRDAEESADDAFASICSSLTRAGLDAPLEPLAVTQGNPKISVFVLPDCAAPGMLETLCSKALSNDPAFPCVSQYFDCLAEGNAPAPRPIDKAHMQAFLASRERPGLQLGEAAHAGYLALEDPTFDSLKGFLQRL